MTIDISNYKAGRFADLMEKPFSQKLWGFLADKEQTDKMFLATKQGLPAIEFFLKELEVQFEEHLKSELYPEEEIAVFANNMIKQIMQYHGYIYTACGLCPEGKYIKMSGVYAVQEK